MPIIAVEEEDEDVFGTLVGPDVGLAVQVGPPADHLGAIVSIDEDEQDGDTFELCSIASSDQLNISIGNSNSSRHRNTSKCSSSMMNSPITAEEESEGSDMFELCSITSQASLSQNDLLNVSIGKSSSSRHKILKRSGSRSDPLNRSIGSSTSSIRKEKETVVVPKTEDISVKYFIDYSSNIGKGTNTIVRKCIERSTGNRYAVKSVRRSDKLEYEHMRTEANLLASLDHPSIIKIYDTYEDEKCLHMIMEICKGGELFDHVMAKTRSKEGHYSEETAAVIVHRVVDAVSYIHECNIVHRDLKLENILFKSKLNNKKKDNRCTEVRVIDFGLSRKYNTHHRLGSLKKLSSFVGTKYYVAPEVLNHSYTHAADLWSIGVLAYALLSAQAPFVGRDDQEIYDKITHCDSTGVEFPSPDWDHVTAEAKDFIRSLLVKDAATRPTACELLEHPWIINAGLWKKEIDTSAKAKSKMSVFGKIFRFREKNK